MAAPPTRALKFSKGNLLGKKERKTGSRNRARHQLCPPKKLAIKPDLGVNLESPPSVKKPIQTFTCSIHPTNTSIYQRHLLGAPVSLLPRLLPQTLAPNFQPYRFKQLHEAIYKQGITSFSQITTLPIAARKMLDDECLVGLAEGIEEVVSRDGTRKCLLSFPEKYVAPVRENEDHIVDSGGLPERAKKLAPAKIECVYIPSEYENEMDGAGMSECGSQERGDGGSEGKRNTATLCVSSQVGCSLSCTFCHTGTQKLLRNLEPSEMIAQVMHGLKIAGDFNKTAAQPRTLTNIVLMGQGEPLYNNSNLIPFLHTLIHTLGFHPSRITLSTSGIAPLIPQIATSLGGVSLAVSLHAATDSLRSKLMPINNQYPLDSLFAAIKSYLHLRAKIPTLGARHSRVTFEYVLLQDVNDSLDDAKRLVALLKRGLNARGNTLRRIAHVNLIPFHGWEGSGYVCSEMERIEAFMGVIREAGLVCTLRVTRGDDVLGACGQLRSMDMRKKVKVV